MTRKPQKIKTLLVDGNSLFYTCFEATKSTPMYETGTNGIYTFLMKLKIILDRGNHNRLRIAFDGKGSGDLRRDIYSDYKASRKKKKAVSEMTQEEIVKKESFKKQKKRLQEYLSYFANWYEDTVVEADDVIARYVKFADPNEEIEIVTGDVDIMQLLKKGVSVHYLKRVFAAKTPTVKRYMKNKQRSHLTITHKTFQRYFGYPPENIVIIKTVCGDDSDEIKNIQGVKETTLFNQFPKMLKETYTVERLLEECRQGLKEDGIGKKRQKALFRILNGVTLGKQGKDIININHRLVDLSNEEFLTEECKLNLSKNGFLSKDKFQTNGSHQLKEMFEFDGIYEHIKTKFTNLRKFFKPFLKTIDR